MCPWLRLWGALLGRRSKDQILPEHAMVSFMYHVVEQPVSCGNFHEEGVDHITARR